MGVDRDSASRTRVMSLLPHQKLVRWNRSKIMSVGQGRAGKTALVNNLTGRWMGEIASTIGAEQMDMRLLYGGVNGGRLEEYKRPKQELEALLAELSYYDDKDAAERESCRKELKFWLNSITMHTSDSNADSDKTAPVAIVGTRGDKVVKEEDHEEISSELEDMFGEMKVWESLMWYAIGDGSGRLCFFPNNNTLTKNNAVSQELLRSIEQSLGAADYMRREIPMMWIKMLDEMKGLDRSYLSYEEILRMTEVKYQQSKEEKGLEDVIILDPIEYLVKPATTIICKHVATKDDPYRTRHEVTEIHGATLTGGKKTHVFLSHDWGIDGNNHNRVKQVSEALKSRGLVTWIDEDRIVNEIEGKIIDGIDHTECMLVFVTENYVRKVNGGNDKDY
eukprot:gene14069-biopygen3173